MLALRLILAITLPGSALRYTQDGSQLMKGNHPATPPFVSCLPRRRTATFSRLCCLTLAPLALAGCLISIISGPSEVSLGETVVYELDVSSEVGGDSDIVLTVVVEAPDGWALVSSSFTGVIDGSPVGGSGTVVPESSCGFMFGVPRPGMKRLRIDAGPFPKTVGSEKGTVTLEFQALAQPDDEFKIGFVFGGRGSAGGGFLCSRPAYRTINRNNKILSFLEAHFDDADVTTLGSSDSVQITPDGNHVLSTAQDENALNLFQRNTQTGELTFVESYVEGGAGGIDGMTLPTEMQISPEGSHVFVSGAGDFAIAIFQVGESELSYSGAYFGGRPVRDMVIWDRFLYTTIDLSVRVFERDLATGGLSSVQTLTFEPSVNHSLRLVVSPDGHHVYLTRTGRQIAILNRATDTGQLSIEDFVGTPFEPGELVLSPDGRHLYVISGSDNMLGLYRRDTANGALSLVESWDRFDLGDYLFEPKALAMSPSGDILFLASSQAISAWAHHPNGGLKLLDFEVEGDPPVTGIPKLRELALSSDGRFLYTASRDPGSVAVFVAGPAFIFTDGFESGNMSAWSSHFP